jgi:hypothetical protein
VNLAALHLDAEVLVHDPDPPLLGEGDGQPRFGDRVHRGRHQRNIQADVRRQERAGVDMVGQDRRSPGDQQDVIERKGVLSNPMISGILKP